MTHKLTPDIAQMYKDAWEKWGEYSQLTMINEECAEVIQAVCKYLRKQEIGPLDSIVGEIVDATIMFEQFLLIFEREDLYFTIRRMKLKRLKERLNK